MPFPTYDSDCDAQPVLDAFKAVSYGTDELKEFYFKACDENWFIDSFTDAEWTLFVQPGNHGSKKDVIAKSMNLVKDKYFSEACKVVNAQMGATDDDLIMEIFVTFPDGRKQEARHFKNWRWHKTTLKQMKAWAETLWESPCKLSCCVKGARPAWFRNGNGKVVWP